MKSGYSIDDTVTTVLPEWWAKEKEKKMQITDLYFYHI